MAPTGMSAELEPMRVQRSHDSVCCDRKKFNALNWDARTRLYYSDMLAACGVTRHGKIINCIIVILFT